MRGRQKEQRRLCGEAGLDNQTAPHRLLIGPEGDFGVKRPNPGLFRGHGQG